MEQTILKFENVSKFFPGVTANKNVTLSIYKGEIHSLLGENGAGKTTLMNVLYGLYHCDEGKVIYEGKEVGAHAPSESIRLGIGMIHQHFMLIPTFSVWENVALGQKPEKGHILNTAKIKREIRETAKRLSMDIDLEQKVGELSVGMQQKVEILKAIYRGARLLILDEPTSVLTPQESEELFATLRELKRKNCTIIFISHKLKEVLSISDRISVLRDGELIATKEAADCTSAQLTALMVGRDVSLNIDKKECSPGEIQLEIRDVSAEGETLASSLKHVSFAIRSGEIVGIAGVDGNGQNELANIIAGIRQASGGSVFFHGRDVTSLGVVDRFEQGFSYIPADRRGEGLTMGFRLYENTLVTQYYKSPFCQHGILNFKTTKEKTKDYIRDFRVKAPGTDVAASTLSGGNQQKLILARELSKSPDILLIVQPTWGLDIGACEFVYQQMLLARERGAAILLISTDLEEIRALSDRLLVIYAGKIMGELDPATAKAEEIGELMMGGKQAG